ncbi:hypothetical protein CLCR_00518 [Cladophialophora carrionii]|uniref:Uncharacterized protein n=1 Tax=Cladophialophora carrionii TaxID=86049 RepID=A0A1C1CBZ4_9EURO|nr:hypothetical protein CLCR_00518 [Cladophialophora carrionii]
MADAPAPPFLIGWYNLGVSLSELREWLAKFFSRRHSDENKEIISRYNYNDATHSPGLEFLTANNRTVSFGTKIGHHPDANLHQECVELSAWYDRSGSMVCAERERDRRPVVIDPSLVQGDTGDKDSDRNTSSWYSNTEIDRMVACDYCTELGMRSDPEQLSKRVTVI